MVILSLQCVIVGVAGNAFPVDIDENLSVGQLKEAIEGENVDDPALKNVAAKNLRLFLAKAEGGGRLSSLTDEASEDATKVKTGKWLSSLTEDVKKLQKGEKTPLVEFLTHENKELQGESGLKRVLAEMQSPSTDEIHALVVVLEGNSAAFPNIAWYGAHGSMEEGEGDDLKDLRFLGPLSLRISSTDSERLVWCWHIIDNEDMYMFNFLALSNTDDTFEDNFKKQCQIDWKDAVSAFPTKPNCVVYLVVDEAQATHSEGISSLRKSAAFWNLVKYVISNGNYSIRILMFAAHGCGVEYTRLGTLIQFNNRIMLGIDQLNFSHAEVSEYAQNWFKGITCFEGSSLSAMEEFCGTLEEVTGGHVGLCATTIDELNKVYASRNRSASRQPLPAEWIRMLQTGSLDQTKEDTLFEALTLTPAVRVLDTLGEEKLIS